MQQRTLIAAFLICLLAFLVNIPISTGQGINIGVPPLWNFSRKSYKAGTQNWDAAQDKNGVMYWANNEGLLQYDGSNWRCYPVANRTIVRSVAIHSDGRIYAGAQSEFGYYYPAADGQLQYHSLVDMLPTQQQNFEDVWDICFQGELVFFRTNNTLFQYDGQNIHTHKPGGSLTALFSTPAGLLAQQNFSNILYFESGQFKPFIVQTSIQSAITGCMRWNGDTVVISTLKDGLFFLNNAKLYPFHTAHDAQFQKNRIYTASALPNGQLALGTSLNGLYVLDQNRRIYRHISKKHGIQNNNILHTFADKTGNLWLGLDSGIDCIVLDAPFTTLIPDEDLQGTGYAAAVFQDQLYLGVSNGVYKMPWQRFYNPEQSHFFEKIPASDGQVWSLNAVNGSLLLGHHEGAFALDEATIRQLSPIQGAWNFVQMTPEYLIGGTYSGLILYKKVHGAWFFQERLNGLNESCRILAKDDDGALWVAHPYRGLYRVIWHPSRPGQLNVEFYNQANGLPSDLNNYVFQIAGKAIFATEKGVYRFDRVKKQFFIDEDFEKFLGRQQRIKTLKEDYNGNIWYVADSEAGILAVDDFGLKKSVQKKVFPDLADRLVGGFEFIYPIDSCNVLLGGEKGFIHYNPQMTNPADSVLQLIMSQIQVGGTKDSTLYWGWSGQSTEAPVLDATLNNLRFSFSATDYKDPSFIQYRFRLGGLNANWSAWSAENTRTFLNLRSGEYRFEVQARRKDGLLSPILAYSFEIKPPWYASTTALVLYALAFLGFFAGFLMRQQRKFEYEKAEMRVQHLQKAAEQQQEVERSRAAILEMQHQKYEAEIHFKNQELASATMHLVQKGELLLTVQDHLNAMLEKSESHNVKKEIQQLLNLLNFDAKLDDDWEQFAYHFDQVHVNFLKRLREQFPQLGANDYKLCAYLRMNLSTKEIAPLLNISIRGVEASRYRLRKKLGLSNDANLTDFVLGL